VLTVVDQGSRQSPVLECGLRLMGQDMAGRPPADRRRVGPAFDHLDDSSESMTRSLEDRAYHRGAQLDFTRRGRPRDNMYSQALNGKLRDRCLNLQQVVSLPHPQAKIESLGVDSDEQGTMAPSRT
jgi:putative transposase